MADPSVVNMNRVREIRDGFLLVDIVAEERDQQYSPAIYSSMEAAENASSEAAWYIVEGEDEDLYGPYMTEGQAKKAGKERSAKTRERKTEAP